MAIRRQKKMKSPKGQVYFPTLSHISKKTLPCHLYKRGRTWNSPHLRGDRLVIYTLFSSSAITIPKKKKKPKRTQQQNLLEKKKLFWPLIFLLSGMTRWVVLVTSGCHSEIPWIGWLKQWDFVSHHSEGWNVQDQSLSKLDFSWGLSPWLADGCLLAVPSYGLVPVHEWQSSLVSLSLPILLKYGPTQWPHWTLITSIKFLSPNVVTLG